MGNTLHTVRTQTHSPPVLHLPVCKTSWPLPLGNSAFGTPHHANPVPLHSTAQHSTAQHSTAQHSTAQHSTAQHSTSTAQHSTAQHSTAQHSTAQHSTAQHSTSTAQHSTAQHSTAQHSTAQHSTSTAQHSTAQHSTAQHSTARIRHLCHPQQAGAAGRGRSLQERAARLGAAPLAPPTASSREANCSHQSKVVAEAPEPPPPPAVHPAKEHEQNTLAEPRGSVGNPQPSTAQGPAEQ